MSHNLCVLFIHLFNLRPSRGFYEDNPFIDFHHFKLDSLRPQSVPKTTKPKQPQSSADLERPRTGAASTKKAGLGPSTGCYSKKFSRLPETQPFEVQLF